MSVRRQKRTQKAEEAENVPLKQKLNFDLKRIKPLTSTQELVFRYRDENQLLYGSPGTGKSFLALWVALDDVIEKNLFKKIVIVRSVVEVRKMGFLPGDEKQKAAVYEAPYKEICNELFGRGDAYEILKQKGVIQFISTSHIRGINLNDSFIIFDEFQNTDRKECASVLTRFGKNSKIFICGDGRQEDLSRNRETSGAFEICQIIHEMNLFKFISFGHDDIVRSEFVKQFIIAEAKLEALGRI